LQRIAAIAKISSRREFAGNIHTGSISLAESFPIS
jgi:hypothetical protein